MSSLPLCLFLLLISCIGFASAAESTNAPSSVEKIMNLSLEDILNTEVTSVSKHKQSVFESAAAVYVISNDDIKRSGARTIPEALRLAPGIFVGQINASSWGIGSRGFGERWSPYLLVMIDGRSIWSMTTGGIEWTFVDYFLEDIDRIEIVRGPGGTLWGANAVNGVINIITKSASKNPGGYIEGGGGTEYRGFGGVRYSMKIGREGFLRGYLKGDHFEEHPTGFDYVSRVQGGFRADWELDDYQITWQGDYFRSENGAGVIRPSYFPPYADYKKPFPGLTRTAWDGAGANTLLRYNRQISLDSDIQFQTYYDYLEHDDGVTLDQKKEAFDVEFQHRFGLPRQSIIYGAGYRYMPTVVDTMAGNRPFFIYMQKEYHYQLANIFAQDEISLIEDKLKLTLGSKLEYHDTIGWQALPNGRLLWLISPKQTAWGAVSRSVQAPGSAKLVYSQPVLAVEPRRVPVGGGVALPAFVSYYANPDLEGEYVNAYEMGYRIQPTTKLSLDFAGFLNDYENAAGMIIGPGVFRPAPPAPAPHIEVPLITDNSGEARTIGGEFSGEYRLLDNWRITAAYSYINITMNEQMDIFNSGDTPSSHASLRNSFDLPAGFQFDLWNRYVHDLADIGRYTTKQPIQSYWDMDVRLAWNATPNFGMALVGQNLLQSEREEFLASPVVTQQSTPVPRGVYFTAWYRF